MTCPRRDKPVSFVESENRDGLNSLEHRKVPRVGNAGKIIEFTDAPNGIYISKWSINSPRASWMLIFWFWYIPGTPKLWTASG